MIDVLGPSFLHVLGMNAPGSLAAEIFYSILRYQITIKAGLMMWMTVESLVSDQYGPRRKEQEKKVKNKWEEVDSGSEQDL